MSNYYVFRINYDDHFKVIRNEIMNGRLRQGWGAQGMCVEDSFNDYKEGWFVRWPKDTTDDAAIRRKYNNIRIMMEIEQGDVIVVPKLDITGDRDYPCRCFSVFECTEKYHFSVLDEGEKSDFGHIIGVKPLFSCSYRSDRLAPITIAGKFKAYQKALNRVNNGDFISAVNELIDTNDKTPISTSDEAKDYTFIMAQELSEKFAKMAEDNLINLRKMDPKGFEYLIKELFEKNGFICKRMNNYDGEGGDIDIQMILNEKSLLGSVFRQAKGEDTLYINIQAKKKEGKDWDAKAAAEQLVKKRKTSGLSHYIDIVIDLTDDYDEETEKYANENQVVLINGMQFSYLLLQYGLADEIDI